MTLRRGLWLSLLAAAPACSGLLGIGATGTIQVRVHAEGNAPVPGARVAVSQQSGSGGAFAVSQLTSANGTTDLGGIQVGDRSVTVTLPAGYSAGMQPLTRSVTVERDRTIELEFALVRSAIPIRQ